MIFFFTVVTVILPALVLAGVVAFAAHDARERSALEHLPSPKLPRTGATPNSERAAQFKVPGTKFQVGRPLLTHNP
jgi:hypothetical protein